MRVGNMDGTPEDICNLLENNGLKLDDYIQRPQKTWHDMSIYWIVVPVLLYIAVLFTAYLCKPYAMIFFLAGAVVVVMITIILHLKFTNGWISIFTAIAGVLILLVSVGMVSPTEVPKIIKELIPK